MAQFTYPKLQGLKAAYDEAGYAIVRQVLDADLLGEANRHIDWLIDKHPDLRTERLGHWLVADDPFWLRLIGDDRLLDVAEQLIGPDIALFAAAYVVKRPGTGGRFAWHQDGSYWPRSGLSASSRWRTILYPPGPDLMSIRWWPVRAAYGERRCEVVRWHGGRR